MTANASAALTIKVVTLGLDSVKALNAELAKLGATGQRAARGGLGALGAGVSKAAAGAGGAAGKFRTLEQELARLQIKMDQERITAKARGILNGPPGTPGMVGKLRTVESEMARLDLLAKNRAITAQARANVGQGPDFLTGHGFVHKGRQVLGVMRDVATVGIAAQMGFRAMAGGVHAVIDPMREFESVMADVKIKGGFSTEQMKAIEATARKSGRTSQFGAIQSGQAAVELAAAGLGGEEIATQMPTVLKFSQAAGLGTETGAATLVETMSQFGKTAEDFSLIGNTLVKAANMSTISVGDMSETLKYVGPIANSAGLELEQVAAMTALLGERGIKGSMAGTALRTVIVSLVQPGRQAKKAMQELGLSTEEMQAGIKDLPGFMQKLDGMMKDKGLDQSKRLSISKRLFGAEGLAAVETLMGAMSNKLEDGTTAWEKYRDGVANAGSAMEDAAKEKGDTMEGKLARLSASAESAKLAIGGGLAPVLLAALPVLSDMAVKVGQFAEKHETLTKVLAVGVPAAAMTLWAGTGLAAMVTSAGVAFAAAGTSVAGMFAAAFVPAVLAALAGFGVGTLIADAIGMEDIGAKIYDWLHPEEAKARLPTQGRRGMGGPMSPAEALKQEAAAVEAQNRAAGGFNMEADAAGNGAKGGGFRATDPVKGKIVVEIKNGKGSVASMDVAGPLDLGWNMGQ